MRYVIMELKITPSGQTIVKPTALGPGANTDTKLLIYGLFQKGRVLAQDEVRVVFKKHKRVAKPLMVALSMIMIDELGDGPARRS